MTMGTRRLFFPFLALLVPLLATAAAQAGQLTVLACGSWSRDSGPFQPTISSSGLTAQAQCGLNETGLLVEDPKGAHVPYNASAGWQTIAPTGITISNIYTVGDEADNIGTGVGWWGEFYWDSGRSSQLTNNFSTYGCCQATFNSQRIGWFFACALANGCSGFAAVLVGQVDVTATETQAPTIVALGNNLWYQNGWARGVWPISFAASDPSGVCNTSAVFGSLTLSGPGGTKNTDAWHQCPDQSWTVSVDTSTSRGSIGVGEGTMPLALVATNAAGVSTGPMYAKTVDVDNQAPVVTISGPTDAPATAGTQYVTATGSAGPSGVSAVGCSLDGAPTQWSAGASAQVAVSGVGMHHVICYSANNARDAAGSVATSAPATWTLDIRQPTVSAIGFSRIVDKLRCHRALERVRVPARWVTVRRHHRLVRVHRRAHTRIGRVTKCQMQTVRRRVTVWTVIRRHGRKVRVKQTKTVHVPVPPHGVTETTSRVGHGQGTTVNGWLGLPDGTALGGQTVGGLHRARQRRGQVPAGGGCDKHGRRRVERDAAGRAVTAGRGGVRRRRDARAGNLCSGHADCAREDPASDHAAVGCVDWGDHDQRPTGGWVRATGRRRSATADSVSRRPRHAARVAQRA